MICKKCGKEIQEGSISCPYCGCDLKSTISSNHQPSSEEQLPLVLMIKYFMRHKILVIAGLVVVVLSVGGYIAYNRYQQQKELEEAITANIKHILDIAGVYENSDKTLILHADHTVELDYNKKVWEKSVKGYWREKFDGELIEINLSTALEDVYIGSKKLYYCNTLYLVGTTLWEDLSAIRAKDYSSAEDLTKK